MNEIDKLDGMVKIKGKCGYEIIGGCGELRKAKAKLEKIKHIMNVLNNVGYYKDLEKTVLQIIEGAEDE